MGDIGNAIKYLYDKFILRDLLSFVMPGAVVVLTACLLFLPESSLVQRLDTLFRYSRDMYWLLYIPLFGLFFMVGFAVQCFGEIFDIIRFTPKGQGCWRQRFKIFLVDWANPNNIWWMKDHKDMADFWEAAERNENAQQGRERLVVLKQMCANGFLAIAIAGILILLNYLQASLWFLLVVWVPLLASLFWGYRVHVLRQNTRERIVVDRKKGQDTKDPKENNGES